MSSANWNILAKPKSLRQMAVLLAAISISLLAGVTIYILASRFQGALPPMPRVDLDQVQCRAAMDHLQRSATAVQEDQLGRALIAQIEQLHLAETDSAPTPEASKSVRFMIGEVERLARELAQRNEKRFLALGDRLAQEFHTALTRLLAESNTLEISDVHNRRDAAVQKVWAKGGAFLTRALESGLIDGKGCLHSNKILPQILFRIRWRHFGSLELDKGFLPVEKLARWDFVATFSSAEAIKKRLTAVEQIIGVNANYDSVIARALIFYEGGDEEAARAELSRALGREKGTESVNSFVAFLNR